MDAWLEIMKRSSADVKQVTVAVGGQQVAGYNKNRVAIGFTRPGTNICRLYPKHGDPAASFDGAIDLLPRVNAVVTFNPDIGIRWFTLRDHGDLVRSPWDANAVGGSDVILVIEILADVN